VTLLDADVLMWLQIRPTRRLETLLKLRCAGGTASGKTTVCDLVKQRLNDQCVVMLSQDSFYRGLTPAELQNVSGEALVQCAGVGSLL